ncbi:MAG: BamA/TamA family outer membrane protein, partial [Gemmatimonadota bacterium]
RDYRDHYHRRGWSAYLAYSGRARPLDLRLEYRNESHGTVEPRTPWSLLSNDDPWRPQPLVAEGDLSTLRGSLRWDTRNDPVEPSSGWLVSLDIEQGLEGDLVLLRGVGDPPVPLETGVEEEFTALTLDVRRYLRVGPRTRIAVRALAAGSPDDGALPPQRQHALGGEGSLPGFDRFAFDCGARSGDLVDGFYPYYGCDRVVLFQGEARFSVLGDSDISLGRRLGLDFDLLTTPELVFFLDAGRGWIEAESLAGRENLGSRDFNFDGGVGLRLGRLGFYIATPITDGGGGLNFLVRLGPRL